MRITRRRRPAGTTSLPRRNTLIAVIDDSEHHRRQIQAALTSFYPTILYSDAGLALAEFHEAAPRVLLVDVDIPPLGGCEFIRLIRRQETMADVPVVLVAKDEQVARTGAIECGADAFLVKPFRRSTAVRTISGLLNKGIERQWDALPPLQGQILRETKGVFDQICDVVGTGVPIDYPTVITASLPLVDAVATDDFHGILAAVRDHDDYTYVHSLKTAIGLLLFGRAIGLAAADMELLAVGGLLHDVGKMAIPYEILNKPGKLTPEEFAVMRTHVVLSTSILEGSHRVSRGVVVIAGQHHETLDGSGYPNGLAGSQLNELARMASIIDIFGALTDRRAYKEPMSPEAALAVMAEMTGKIDHHLLSMFREVFLDSGLGHSHEWSEGVSFPSDSMEGIAVTRSRTSSA